jgi:hypothetical protein
VVDEDKDKDNGVRRRMDGDWMILHSPTPTDLYPHGPPYPKRHVLTLISKQTPPSAEAPEDGGWSPCQNLLLGLHDKRRAKALLDERTILAGFRLDSDSESHMQRNDLTFRRLP